MSSRDFRSPVAFWALFFAATSAWLALFLLAARLGLDTAVGSVLGSLTFSVGIAFSPFLMRASDATGRPPEAREIAWPLALVMAVPLLGFALGRHAIWLMTGVALVGVVRALPYLRRMEGRQWLYLAAFPLCCAYYIFAELHSGELLFTHAWLPEHALMGVQVVDTYYHAALTNMIQEHGVASTGLDGLARHYYHLGSHYWLAGFGLILQTGAVNTFMSVVIVVLLPAVMLAFVYSILFVAVRAPAGCTRVGPGAALFVLFISVSHWKAYLFASESLGLSLVLLSLAVMVLVDTLQAPIDERRRARWERMALSTLLLAMMAPTKGPTGVVWLAAIGYVWLRRYRLSVSSVLVLAIPAGTFLFVMSLFFVPELKNLVEPMGASVVTSSAIFNRELAWQAFRYCSGIFVLVITLLIALRRDFMAAASFRAYTDSVGQLLSDSILRELIAVSLIVSMLLTLTAQMGVYFAVVLLWIAAPIAIVLGTALLSYPVTSQWWSRRQAALLAVGAKGSILALAGIVLVKLSFTPTPNGKAELAIPGTHVVKYMVTLVDSVNHGQLLAGRSATQYLSDSVHREGVLFDGAFRTGLKRTVGAMSIQAVEHELPALGRDRSAVFVEPTNSAFWRMPEKGPARGGWYCEAVVFFVPAVIGIPMLRGLIPAEIKCELDGYGFGNYPADARSQTTTDPELCDRARRRQMDFVIVVSGNELRQQARTLRCTQGG